MHIFNLQRQLDANPLHQHLACTEETQRNSPLHAAAYQIDPVAIVVDTPLRPVTIAPTQLDITVGTLDQALTNLRFQRFFFLWQFSEKHIITHSAQTSDESAMLNWAKWYDPSMNHIHMKTQIKKCTA
jgi:hypothetical protein